MKFSDFAEINPKVKLKKGESYPFIEMEDLTPGLRYASATKEKVFKGEGSRFKTDDIIFARITPCLEHGKIAQVKGKENEKFFGSTEFFVFRAKDGVSEGSFLFYLSYSDILRKPAEKSMYGASGRQRASIEVVKAIEVPNIPFETQRKIAAILSAYDDLIENNTRRMQILEEMAQRIYQEWFVNFRFPGHEIVKFVDSELGKIPEGWEVKSINDILEYHIGGGWGKEQEESNFKVPAYVIRGTDIPNVRMGNVVNCPLRYHTESNFKSRKIKSGDIIFEVSGGSKDQPLGRSLLIDDITLRSFNEPVICASFCKLMRINCKIVSPELIYLKLLKMYDDRSICKYQVQSTGISNFKFVFFLNAEKIIVPPNAIKERFDKAIKPIFSGISLLGQRNAKLRTTRDLLLPKLISGELDVSNLDIIERSQMNHDDRCK